MPGQPGVTEIVAARVMRIRLRWQPQHRKGQVRRRGKQEGDGCLKGGEVAEHKEGEKLSGNNFFFFEKNNPPVQTLDKWGPRCFLQPALRLSRSQNITDAKTSSLP